MAPVASDPRPPVIDCLIPPEMALKAEHAGAEKARRDLISMFVLAVLAGAFIALGAIFSTVVAAGAGDMPYGVVRLLAGLVFSLGLVLVVIGGAELFTGDNLMVMAWAGRKIGARELATAWIVIYVGNFVGAAGTAVLVFLSGHYQFGGGAIAVTALRIADAKGALPFVDAFFLGVLCNVLVCLAVWMCFSARTVTGKVTVIVPPIAAFVAAGFEHSIANMYFLTIAPMILDHAPTGFLASIEASSSAYPFVGLGDMARNLLPVTLGNMVGGIFLVGLVYWFIYLRPRLLNGQN